MSIYIGDKEIKNLYIGGSTSISDMQGPAPDGFHVPTQSEWQALINAGISLGAWSAEDGSGITTYLKVPLAGYRRYSDGAVQKQGVSGFHWTSSSYLSGSTLYGKYFSFDATYVGISNSNTPNGYIIRPFKNIAIVPDNTWTKLKSGTGTAGIYHNSALGLISISSDGNTWTTISDKNLGATTVYSSGATLNEANCGKYYQRGNDYGFPFTGSVTTSSTRVNASTYGPGNYYSSDTFITYSDGWDSSKNANLRGGVTQGTTEKGAAKEVYLGENKVRPPFKPAQESIVIKLTANSSGTLYVATAGYGADGNFGASYKWNISVDDGQSSYYSGSSSNGGVISLSGYTANTDHIVTITPSTESYGWARAFGWRTVSSTYKNLFKEVLYDGSYMGYATSATSTGNRFRASQYYGTALTKAPDEYIPNTVTTIGSDFRADQYYGCTGLLSSPDEYIPNSVTSIGGNFRSEQYYGCSNLISSGEEALPNTVTSIGGSFRQYQYNSCASLENVKGWKDLSIGNSSLYRYRQFYSTKPSGLIVKVLSDVGYASYSNQTLQDYYVSQVQVPSTYLNNFINSTKQPRANITDSKFVGY